MRSAGVNDPANAVTSEAKPYASTMNSAIMPSGLRAKPFAVCPKSFIRFVFFLFRLNLLFVIS